MKKLHYILLLLPVISLAQNKPVPKAEDKIIISKKLTALPGEFYVDSVKVDLDRTILDPTNIKEVRVFKPEGSENNKAAKGATLITRRSKVKLMSVQNLVNFMRNGSVQLKDAKKVNVQIDNRFITDLKAYQIEKSAISTVDFKTDETKKDKEVTIIIATKAATKKK